MTAQKERKQGRIEKFRADENDTGSSEVQIAILSDRIKHLTEHFKTHKKDYHSRLGLIKMVNRRKRLLDYVKKKGYQRYKSIIEALGIRR